MHIYFMIALISFFDAWCCDNRGGHINTPIVVPSGNFDRSLSADDIICETAFSLLDSFNVASPDLVVPYVRDAVRSSASLPSNDHQRISADLIRRRSGDLSVTDSQSLAYVHSIVIQAAMKAIDDHKNKSEFYQTRLNKSWSRKSSSIIFSAITAISTTLVGLIVHYNNNCK